MWRMLSWSLEHVLRGVHPSRRHDGGPFRGAEAHLQDRSGTALGFRGLCCWVKSDIAEYSTSLGLPGLTDSISPCCFCFLNPEDQESFYAVAGLSPLGAGFPAKTHETYHQACLLCEKRVPLTASDRSKVARTLAYDKSKQGSSGRALVADVPELGLARGTRVEPSDAL